MPQVMRLAYSGSCQLRPSLSPSLTPTSKVFTHTHAHIPSYRQVHFSCNAYFCVSNLSPLVSFRKHRINWINCNRQNSEGWHRGGGLFDGVHFMWRCYVNGVVSQLESSQAKAYRTALSHRQQARAFSPATATMYNFKSTELNVSLYKTSN